MHPSLACSVCRRPKNTVDSSQWLLNYRYRALLPEVESLSRDQTMHMTELREVSELVLQYDMSFITKRFAEEQGLHIDLATKYEREMKRYFLLRFLQKRRYGMMGKTDEYWHLFIIYTKQYHEFCAKAFGTYLHHRPAEIKSTDLSAGENILYIRFLVDYYRFFKEIPPSEVWPFSMEVFGDMSDEAIAQGICMAPCLTNCST